MTHPVLDESARRKWVISGQQRTRMNGWVLAKGRTQFAGEGERRRAVRATGLAVDITDRKRMEEALREADRRKDEFLATRAAGFDEHLVKPANRDALQRVLARLQVPT